MTAKEKAMFAQVEGLLKEYDANHSLKRGKVKYSRIDHTKRVYKWVLKLIEAYPDKESLDIEALKIATIFHDCGYNTVDRKHHAIVSAGLCRNYLDNNKYPRERIDFICDLISRHSDKEKLHDDIPMELVLLMEADLLDDTGAQGIVVDIWMETAEENVTFESILEHLKWSVKVMAERPMRTQAAKEIWERKRQLVNQFYMEYREDIVIE